MEAPAVLAEAVRISPSAITLRDATSSWSAPKVIELARLFAMAGDATRAQEILRALFELASDQARDGAQSDIANVQASQVPSFLYRPGVVSAHEALIVQHGRIFPVDETSADYWAGAKAWVAAAANAMLDWAADDDIYPESVIEGALVAAYQLDAAGEGVAARAIQSRAAALVVADTSKFGMRTAYQLALMGRHLGVALPEALSVALITEGILTADQEAMQLREMAASGNVSVALATGRRATDGMDKLAVLEVLKSLAETAGEYGYAKLLEARIDAALQARDLLDPTFSR